MIREWRLKRFKSVRSDTSLLLRPLTVLTGPNSSGKSSLLQSILLIQQTLLSKVSRRQLVLNGDLVKLGTFQDVLSEDSMDDEVSVGFTLVADLSESSRSRRLQASPYYLHQLYHSDEVGVGKFQVNLTFGPADVTEDKDTPKPSNLQAALKSGSYSSVLYNVADEQAYNEPFGPDVPILRISRRTSTDIQRLLEAVEVPPSIAKSPDEHALRFQVDPDFGRLEPNRNLRFHMQPFLNDGFRPVAVQLDHFLPAIFINRYQTARRRLFAAYRDLIEFYKGGADPAAEPQTPYADAIIKTLRPQAVAQQQTLAAFLSKIDLGWKRREEESMSVVEAALPLLPSHLVDAAGLEAVPSPDSMQLLSSIVSQEFSILRYLGPLRDEPKPVYSIANSADPTHVGFRGEFTAAVLDLYARQFIDFVPPNEPNKTRRAPLSEAVNEWLSYFDIAESHHTSEEGKLGHRLFIRPGGIGKSLDLTNVGVGVSQVLPIVVMALIAEPGAVLLFEQPELHLHPKVQLRLADFFLAVSKTGRQCIVETHSEYLVNRLRLRIAEQDISERQLRDQIALYFVERIRGASSFQWISIDEFGAIPDWPDGFFDQGPSESDRILSAAQKKRTARSKSNSLRQRKES